MPARRPLLAGIGLVCALVATACTTPPPTADPALTPREVTDATTTFVVVENPGSAPALSYGTDSGFTILEIPDGELTFAFKDMNGNGELDTWEDWRLDPSERAADLASLISIEQAGGLMLFSAHQRSPADGLTERQFGALATDRLRTFLHAGPSAVEPSVAWTNELQAAAETLATPSDPYLPVSIASDPRSDARDSFTGVSGVLSQWPSSLGFAATFDPGRVAQFAAFASAEYRALGITTALSPQLDIATDPRSFRNAGTFGEDPGMVAAMGAAYVQGFQSTNGPAGGSRPWGPDSVATIIKHFPGDSMGEAGRDSHAASGQFAVATGGNLTALLGPFQASTDAAGAMTSYSIITDATGDPAYGDDPVASAYNPEILRVLREDLDFEGMVVTDWGVLSGGPADPDAPWGTAWGVGELPVPERILTTLRAGVDAFGGFEDLEAVMAAFALWQQGYEAGELAVDAETRWRSSARRILETFFAVGLFEDPFLDPASSAAVVGNDPALAAGWQAQLDSVVVTKNDGAAIACDGADLSATTAYIPQSFDVGHSDGRNAAVYSDGPTIDPDDAAAAFRSIVTDEVVRASDGTVERYLPPDLTGVDLVVVGMDGPNNGDNFSGAGFDAASGTYYPLSLQYRPYTADGPSVRPVSIAGATLADGSRENRSYLGATSRVSNEADLDALERAAQAIAASGRDIPLIAVIRAKNPVIPSEFEEVSDAVVIGFGVSDAALLEIVSGAQPSRGRLPMTFPADMDTVEANDEDTPFDLTGYVDGAGNAWEYGFGLSSCTGQVLG